MLILLREKIVFNTRGLRAPGGASPLLREQTVQGDPMDPMGIDEKERA